MLKEKNQIISKIESADSKIKNIKESYFAEVRTSLLEETSEYEELIERRTSLQDSLNSFNTELQKYQAEIGEKTAKVSSSVQNASYYSAESKKYYEWANAEVSSYIQNNSKMINKTMAAQAAQQQRK